MKTFQQMQNSPKNNLPEYIIVHHSAARADQTFKSIQDYHVSLGWENFGYHWCITKDGTLISGRPEHYYGSHCKEESMNTKSVGVLVVGDFDNNLPTKEQETTLKTLLKDIQVRYNIPKEKIVPHRHFLGNPPYKTCYGKLLSDTWAKDLISKPIVNKEDIKKQIISLLNQF